MLAPPMAPNRAEAMAMMTLIIMATLVLLPSSFMVIVSFHFCDVSFFVGCIRLIKWGTPTESGQPRLDYTSTYGLVVGVVGVVGVVSAAFLEVSTAFLGNSATSTPLRKVFWRLPVASTLVSGMKST